jgi:hypothetical protein
MENPSFEIFDDYATKSGESQAKPVKFTSFSRKIYKTLDFLKRGR